MNKYALIIGIEYKNLRENIPRAYKKAVEIRKKLTQNEGYLYKNIEILTDVDTGQGAFHDSLFKPTRKYIQRN